MKNRESQPDITDRKSATVSAAAESSPMVIGLTGGIAAGKSTVARMFAELGAEVIDADAIAHEALRLPEMVKKLRAEWGDEVVGRDGVLDRAGIAEMVFRDPEKLRRLNEWVHPRTLTEMRVRLEQLISDCNTPLIVIDAPLLVEAEIENWCDAILFVATDEERRAARAGATRAWSGDELARREGAQVSLEEKRRRAAAIIDNNQSTDETRSQVRRLFRKWTQSSDSRKTPLPNAKGVQDG